MRRREAERVREGDGGYSVPIKQKILSPRQILAHNAVHAAFAGYTGVTVGLVNTHYVYLPIPVVIQAPRRVDPRGKQWNRLRASIGQPSFVDGE